MRLRLALSTPPSPAFLAAVAVGASCTGASLAGASSGTDLRLLAAASGPAALDWRRSPFQGGRNDAEADGFRGIWCVAT